MTNTEGILRENRSSMGFVESGEPVGVSAEAE
jgi:hypothetical protein